MSDHPLYALLGNTLVTHALIYFCRYAGELFGITNTAATIPGMVAPLAVNAMTPNVSAFQFKMKCHY